MAIEKIVKIPATKTSTGQFDREETFQTSVEIKVLGEEVIFGDYKFSLKDFNEAIRHLTPQPQSTWRAKGIPPTGTGYLD